MFNYTVVEENVKPTTKKTAVKEIKDAEEKPVTPSRRSARIKSNTSIVSDTVQSFDSPRAKRAARRTSQAGKFSITLTSSRILKQISFCFINTNSVKCQNFKNSSVALSFKMLLKIKYCFFYLAVGVLHCFIPGSVLCMYFDLG